MLMLGYLGMLAGLILMQAGTRQQWLLARERIPSGRPSGSHVVRVKVRELE